MKLLLDTHALIWFLNGDPQLSNNARLAIENPANHIFISHAAVWEISIKNSLGKLDLTRPFYELNQQLYDNAIDYLPLVFDHFVSVNRLPLHQRPLRPAYDCPGANGWVDVGDERLFVSAIFCCFVVVR